MTTWYIYFVVFCFFTVKLFKFKYFKFRYWIGEQPNLPKRGFIVYGKLSVNAVYLVSVIGLVNDFLKLKWNASFEILKLLNK